MKRLFCLLLCVVLVGGICQPSFAAEKNGVPFKKQHFSFCSGAGAWSDDLVLKETGSFKGDYHDSDMGDSGKKYDATVYLCKYQGKFKNIKKTGKYMYSLKLGKVKTDEKAGKEEIIERVRYIYTEPYGLDKGKSFILYCPGYPVSKLPKAAKEWIGYANSIKGKKLKGYALYSKKTGYTFYGYAG